MNDDLPGDGWIPWMHRTSTLTSWKSIEMMRRDWPYPQTAAIRDIPPEMNVTGLYWRPLP
jgi:hypothetical protein